jgi:hypothetical protein
LQFKDPALNTIARIYLIAKRHQQKQDRGTTVDKIRNLQGTQPERQGLMTMMKRKTIDSADTLGRKTFQVRQVTLRIKNTFLFLVLHAHDEDAPEPVLTVFVNNFLSGVW